MNRLRLWGKAVKMEIREHKSTFAVYVILRALVIVMMILQILNKNYENAFLCILTLFLFIVPSIIQLQFRIELPKTLEVIILLFIVLYFISYVGYGSSYTQWISGGSDWIFPGGFIKSE